MRLTGNRILRQPIFIMVSVKPLPQDAVHIKGKLGVRCRPLVFFTGGYNKFNDYSGKGRREHSIACKGIVLIVAAPNTIVGNLLPYTLGICGRGFGFPLLL